MNITQSLRRGKSISQWGKVPTKGGDIKAEKMPPPCNKKSFGLCIMQSPSSSPMELTGQLAFFSRQNSKEHVDHILPGKHQSLTNLPGNNENAPTCLARSGRPCGRSRHRAAAGPLHQLHLRHADAWQLPPFGQIRF